MKLGITLINRAREFIFGSMGKVKQWMPCQKCRTEMDWLEEEGWYRCPKCGMEEID